MRSVALMHKRDQTQKMSTSARHPFLQITARKKPSISTSPPSLLIVIVEGRNFNPFLFLSASRCQS
jgi:hypothetical protein